MNWLKVNASGFQTLLNIVLASAVILLVLGVGGSGVGVAEEAIARANTAVYGEQGGNKLIVGSGGEIEIQSGGTIDIQSGATTDFSGGVDLDGAELIVDADADTSITSDTDDQVDMRLEGADQVVWKAVAAADAAATTDSYEIAYTTPVDTTGTNTHNAITVDLAIGNASGGTNNVSAVTIDAITDDPQVVTTAIQVGDEWNYSIDSPAPALLTAMTWFADFIGDTVTAEIVEVSGTDAQAVQAIAIEQYGVYQLTSGNDGANPAADLEAVHSGLIWQADQGSLVFEARLHLDGDINTASVCMGYMDDASTAEMPGTISGTTITTVTDDAVVLCYDTDAATDQWYFIGTDGTTESTGNAITGVAPVADTYQIFRIEVDSGGEVARGYINGALVGSLTANAVNITDLLSCFVSVDSAGNAGSHVVDIDYIYCAADRD